MAQRLEAALRRPAEARPEAPTPPPTAPELPPSPPEAIRLEPYALSEPVPEIDAKTEARTASPKSVLDSLELEMADLLGRPAATPETPQLAREAPHSELGPQLHMAPEDFEPDSAAPTGLTKDDVEASIFAPPRVAPGTRFTVQAYVHVLADRPKVFRTAHAFDKRANRVSARSLTKRIARGATIELFLDCPSLLIDEPFRTIIWKGVPERTLFQVKEASHGIASTIEATLYISVNGITVGDIAFAIQASADGDQNELDDTPTNSQATRYEQAFISYSRRDFDKVSLFAQGLAQNNIRPCVDLTALEPGKEWEQELPRHIADSDVFYLMWSDNAATSRWVRKEWREAVTLYETGHTKRPRIVPITLHRPAPRPPMYLKKFHFDSPWLAQRAAQSVPLFREG
jgi:hypothetical protein